jgi:GntR family negative regulator for fad regulon and positive regulator of fabA
MVNWSPPPRPAALTEQRLIEAFLQGEFPPGSVLPGERDLAVQLGVTRPTLREALQRLARDGWITIQHGRPTRVNDFWWEGNLNVLGAIVRYSEPVPAHFVPNLLAVRLALAPAYTYAAVQHQPEEMASFLVPYLTLEDSSEAFARADWELHLALIRAAGNPIYMLIYNSFTDFYVEMARSYFERSRSRTASRLFYQELSAAAREPDPAAAQAAARRAMAQSIVLWEEGHHEKMERMG